MNARTDTERILDAFLAPEGDRLADRVIDAALADIARTPQRRALRVPWRFPTMPTYLRLAAVAAVVAVVGVGALLFVGGGSTVPPATPSPAPTALPPTTQPSPNATAVAQCREGASAAGTCRLRPFSSSTLTIDVTVPEGGWTVGLPSALGGPVGESNGPNGVAVAFVKTETINSDPCHWDKDGSGRAPQDGDIAVGPTVDELAEALAARSTYESTTPVDATLGGFSGKRLDLHLTPDPEGCDTWDGDVDQYFVFGGREAGQFAQGGANTWQVTIVDVDGTRLIGVVISYEDTSDEDLRAAEGILESVVIRP
jgi:hypothetical protein